jgi:hypothetical protein
MQRPFINPGAFNLRLSRRRTQVRRVGSAAREFQKLLFALTRPKISIKPTETIKNPSMGVLGCTALLQRAFIYLFFLIMRVRFQPFDSHPLLFNHNTAINSR